MRISLTCVGFEKVVADTKGKFCVGDEITLADVFLAPQLLNAERFGVDMTKYPNIVAIAENLKSVPEFEAAHPSRQPDAE